MGSLFSSSAAPTYCQCCGKYMGEHGYVSMICLDCQAGTNKITCGECGNQHLKTKACSMCSLHCKKCNKICMNELCKACSIKDNSNNV